MKKINEIKKYVDKHKERLGLKEHRINILIADDNYCFSDRNHKAEIKKVDYDGEVTVKLIPSKEYTIVIHKSCSEIEKTIIHELLHILFWEMSGWVDTILTLSHLDNELKVDIQKQRDRDEETIVEKLTELLYEQS